MLDLILLVDIYHEFSEPESLTTSRVSPIRDPNRHRIVVTCDSLPFLPLYCFRPRLCPSRLTVTAQSKVLENDRVIVWDVAWLPRAYPTHRHVYDYAGVYYTSGDRVIVSQTGARSPTHSNAWDTFFFRRGVTHSEEGASAEPLRAVFVEFKEPAPVGAAGHRFRRARQEGPRERPPGHLGGHCRAGYSAAGAPA